MTKSKTSQEKSHSFAPGDNVEVVEGELIHLQGKVKSVDGHTILVLPKHEDLKVSSLLCKPVSKQTTCRIPFDAKMFRFHFFSFHCSVRTNQYLELSA